MLSTIEPRQDQLNQLFEEIFPEEMRRSREGEKPRPAMPGSLAMSDEALILKAKMAKNGNEFEALWNGSTIGYSGDESAADMALMDMLAFWTGGNASQMERLFSRSGLGQRDKWRNRQDYRERTIQKAISGCFEFYNPSHSVQTNGTSRSESRSITSADTLKAPEKRGDIPTISEEELRAIKIPENPRFKTCLEPDNFLQEYIRYGEMVTDSYPDYWFGGGLFCLSVAVNRNAVIKLRQGNIYPNVWINELGLSSLSRKSTSIDKTDSTIAAANIDPDCKMPDEFSPEAMIERLDKHPRAYMIKDESAGLLAVMKKDYMRGLKDALMQLYDGKDINRELRTSSKRAEKKKFRVKDPYLCLILATTPGSFAANTELLDITSGWLPRFLHIFPNHGKDRWLPLEEGAAENDLLSTGCHARLIRIRQEFCGLLEPKAMHLSKDASAYFTAWQKVREGELVESKDDRRAQFYSRLAVYALKMGMLFTVGRADYRDGIEISLEHIQEACRLVDEYFMPMALIVADIVGKTADKNLMDRIIAVLNSRGGKLTRREMMKAIHQKRKDLDDALEALEESGEIRLATISNSKGRPSIWITLVIDAENPYNVHNVDNVYSSILSQRKKPEGGNGDSGTKGTLSTNGTTGTKWDNRSKDGDFSHEIIPSTLGQTDPEAETAALGPHPRRYEPTPANKNPDGAQGKRKPTSYSDLAELISIDTSSPEAEKICKAMRLMLLKGDAPRIKSAYGQDLMKLTGLDEATIRQHVEGWSWLRREEAASGEVWIPEGGKA